MQASVPPKSLLLIDDSRDYCTQIERAFRLVQPGTAVFPISDGQRAIEHLVLCGTDRPVPELVLLDRVMPGGPDGCEVVRAIRQMQPLLHLPVLMISGSDDPEHVDQAREAGASGYIVKAGVRADYPELARQVLAWWEVNRQENLLRDCCAHSSYAPSTSANARLTSGAAMMIEVPTPGSAPQNPLGQIHQLLQTVFSYVASGGGLETAGLLADRKVMELTRACREEGIEEWDATGRSRDPVLVLKRGRVIRRLMTLEWSNTELLRRFKVGERTMEDQRRVWREETRNLCGVVARRLT